MAQPTEGASAFERVSAIGLWALVAGGMGYGIVMTVIKAALLFS